MTRAVCDRILKDVNGDISDHLRNHLHLTNCIHLKNHMHKTSPVLGDADRSLMRDLLVLQRSHSLKDPSASPSSWHSSSIVDVLFKRVKNDAMIQEGRRSVGVEHRKEGRRFLGPSPPPINSGTSKVAPSEGADERALARNGMKVGREESGWKTDWLHYLGVSEEQSLNQQGKHLAQDVISRHFESKERKGNKKAKQVRDVQVKTLSQQLNDVPRESDDLASSNIHLCRRFPRQEKPSNKQEPSMRGNGSTLHAVKRCKHRSAGRTRAVIASRETKAENELSVASNSLPLGSKHCKYHMEETDDYADENFIRAPKNGCGIPWNWSRIHHRGKTFLDMAGKGLSHGLSDSRLKKKMLAPSGSKILDMPVASDYSSSSTMSDADAHPLLVDAPRSWGNTEKACRGHEFSEELGIFASNLYTLDNDFDCAYEVRPGVHHKLKGNRHNRHQSLIQKYMPLTFKDMVGQNLIVQALSNAVKKRKVGMLYAFYGRHGTGKTSCARIFARALNCQSSKCPKPCGFCNSCRAYDMGKSRSIREVGPVSNIDFKSIMDLLDNMTVFQLSSQFRVFIFYDCDTLSADYWNAITKVIDQAPRRVVLILVSSGLDVLPHIIISRCQKFFFPKLKDADIMYKLEWIAAKEGLKIDKDALKLIASRSDGSLRDAEMTLEQLGLLGQRISVPIVQELAGLISHEKLVELLDLALSSDTVNTVKNLRVIMETGVEPLALISNLALVITDILAGTYDFTEERQRRKFFGRQPLSKKEMGKLRQALKTLSEAEKQLRMSHDKLTWLTAALLQLASDQHVLCIPSHSNFNHSSLALDIADVREATRRTRSHVAKERRLSMDAKMENVSTRISADGMERGFGSETRGFTGAGDAPQLASSLVTDMNGMNGKQIGKSCKGIEEIWLEVLEKIQVNGMKEFLYQEAKLISVSFGSAPTVLLMFSSQMTKSTAEKFRGHIFQACESVLGSSVTIEIRCDSNRNAEAGVHPPLVLPATQNSSSKIRDFNVVGAQAQALHPDSVEKRRGELVEAAASPGECRSNELQVEVHPESYKCSEGTCMQQASSTSLKKPNVEPRSRKHKEQRLSQSLVRSKILLAHVIQQAEESAQRSRWSKGKAVSIAEKLEQENLALEPRSRGLLCRKAPTLTRRKPSRLKVGTRRPHGLLKLVWCGKCLSSKSPR